MAKNDKQETADEAHELNAQGITGLANATREDGNNPPQPAVVAPENMEGDEKLRYEDSMKAQQFQPEVDPDPVPKPLTSVVGRKERPEDAVDPDAGQITVDELLDMLSMTDIRVRQGGKFVSIEQYARDLRRAKREEAERQYENR